MKFTTTQQQRLKELDLSGEYIDIKDKVYPSQKKRDENFKKIEQKLVIKNKRRLTDLCNICFQSSLRKLEFKLVKLLMELNFTEVVTPIKLARGNLKKMGIEEEQSLWQQVYWIDNGNYCLRPMLAPNLYYLLERFEKNISKPVKIFEVGPCFRKESRGSQHLSEFTMLNLVELGPEKNAYEELKFLVKTIMNSLELEYEICREKSVVYGETIDLIVEGKEVGSGAIGPHVLDKAWNISDSWAGVGFGLERLIMCKENFKSIKRIGRSLIYQDGARLNI